MKNTPAPVAASDDDDPFRDIREVGEYSGGASASATANEVDVEDGDIVDVETIKQVTKLCER